MSPKFIFPVCTTPPDFFLIYSTVSSTSPLGWLAGSSALKWPKPSSNLQPCPSPSCPFSLPCSSQSWQPHPNSYSSLKPGNYPLLVPNIQLVHKSHWLDLQNIPRVWLPLPWSLTPTSLAWIILVASTCSPFFLLHPRPLYSQRRSQSDTSHRNQII